VDLGVPRAAQARVIRPLERLIATALRARLVDRSIRFASLELSGRRAVRTYRLRESGVRLCVEHNTPDVLVVDEIFYQRLYDPPPEVEAVLRAPLRALDAGANIGLFGVWLAGRYPGGELVSFEPDRRNAELLAATIRANPSASGWQMLEAAVATAPGRLGFSGSDFATSHVVEDDSAPTVEAVDFFEYARGAELIKIDIEGSEWGLLADPRMAALTARALVMEYHPERCPGPDSHATALELLARAGFNTRVIFKAPSGVGMVWAWRAEEPSAPA
jgi:FkbM family methyltransferase